MQYQQSLFVKNAGLLQDQNVKAVSTFDQKYQVSSQAVMTVSKIRSVPQKKSGAVFPNASEASKANSIQSQQQNRYDGSSLIQPIQNQVIASKVQRPRMLPVMARLSALNPSLAKNRRAPQPAMIAQSALFTVQNNSRITVKEDHMDTELKVPTFDADQKSLLQRAVSPVMYYGYGYESYPYGYNFGNRYGYGGMGGYGYGRGMGWGGGYYGGMGYGYGGFGGPYRGYYGGGMGYGGYGGYYGGYGLGMGYGGYGPYRRAFGYGGGYGYGRFGGMGGWNNYSGLPLGLGASFEECW